MSDQLEQPLRNQEATPATDSGLHILDLLVVLVRHKKMVIGMPFVVGALTLAGTMLLAPTYTSTAKVMPPPQQSGGLSAMLGQLGGLVGGAAAVKTPNDLYVGLLESRTVSDKLIAQFSLQDRYQTKTADDTRAALAHRSNIINSKKDGMITISVEDTDPKFAAELANAYFNELATLTQTMAITEASQRRLFFEKQLDEAKNQLASAEIALKTTQEKTGVIQPEGQVQAIISSVVQLKASIAAKELQINSMRTFATAQNPELSRAQEELRGLHGQLAKLEKAGSSRDADFMVPTAKLPQAGVEFVRSIRNVKYYETLFEFLAKQYEVAKIDEAKEAASFQLLDKAIPADKKSGPKRGLLTVVGALSGGVLGVAWAFAWEGLRRSRQSPANSRRWQELSLVWKGRAFR